MQWLEINTIPEECKTCTEEDCYNCDTAGKRWILSKEARLRTDRILRNHCIFKLKQKNMTQDAE